MTREEVVLVYKDKPYIVKYSGGIVDLNSPYYEVSFLKEGINLGSMGFVYYNDIKAMFQNTPIALSNTVTFGSDPEFFFENAGGVVPSSEVLPKDSLVVPDGFQGELNPPVSTCREIAGSNIAIAIARAESYAQNAGAKLYFGVGKVIQDDAWKRTPVLARRFGCNPTRNVYTETIRKVTGIRERFRSGGGHIHIGGITEKAKKNLDIIVQIMDVFGGNTSVLIDRDPDNARRRTRYGRAGEYRPKPYGLEYRVYSNFWLRSYVLWSLCSVLLRQSLAIFSQGLHEDFLGRFDMKKVRDAINNNDKGLAMENYLILVDWIKEKGIVGGSGLTILNIDKFTEWVSEDDPISFLHVPTVEDSIRNWTNKITYGTRGFERFIEDYKNYTF